MLYEIEVLMKHKSCGIKYSVSIQSAVIINLIMIVTFSAILGLGRDIKQTKWYVYCKKCTTEQMQIHAQIYAKIIAFSSVNLQHIR